ncbi:MAG: hypothetical protein ACRECJ_04135, partial [Limisphaerales bacterium]
MRGKKKFSAAEKTCRSIVLRVHQVDSLVRTEESRWVLYCEASPEGLAANDLSNPLKQAKNIDRVPAKA